MSAYLIKNGMVYDPLQQTWYKGDVVVENNIIANYRQDVEYTVIDATDQYVSPGFIDYHVHYYNHGCDNGVNSDAASFPCGVTTAVDGGSCGVSSFEMFNRSIIQYTDVRLLSLLHVASGGQATDSYYENVDESKFDIPRIKAMFKKYSGSLVGLKTRISEGIIDAGKAAKSLEKTIEIAEEVDCNVVVHITNPAMDLEQIVSVLRKGDVVCHMYQNKGRETILDSDGKIRTNILKARERGVLFDASNGRSNFDLKVAMQAIRQGFIPDIISSDINTSSFYTGVLHSLPRVMSKYLTFGMELGQILDASILTPARLIGMESLASMKSGTPADLTIFKVKACSIDYRDCTNTTIIHGSEMIVPQMTIKDGNIMYCQADFN